MKEQRFEELFRRHLQGSLTDAEETELSELWLDPVLETKRVQVFNEFYNGLPEDKDMPAADADLIFNQIVQKQVPIYQLPENATRSKWSRIAVAASILLAIGLSSYFLLFNKKEQPLQGIVKASAPIDIVAPETNRAMVVLANGQKVYLDSAANGSLTMQGTVKLVKLQDGKIAYEAGSSALGEPAYNTLINPRGSRVIDITLSDGSRVWLNAGSSVTYPVAFTGNERMLTVDGEAYFEVVHDPSKPFVVSKQNTAIKVLGTHFNVNAYDDEDDMRITLLEGAIQVINPQHTKAVKPGEQAIVKADKINLANDVNVEQVMSWKDGYFRMKGTDLPSLMRQIGRWYDVQVVYKSNIPKAKFGGLINREVNLSDVLTALEQYGIKSRLENGKIVVQ